MMEIPIRKSDKELENEYRRRFYLTAGDPVNTSSTAARHLIALLGGEPAREAFGVIYLNSNNQYIHSEILFKGTLSSSAVYPRIVVINALKHHAAALVIGHNHPSGNLEPSGDDKVITQKIQAACAAIDITLHHHLIVSSEGWFSFADHGFL